MLTSKHQTVNERRASAASRRAFLKFRRASEQKERRLFTRSHETSSEIRSSGTLTAHANLSRASSIPRGVYLRVVPGLPPRGSPGNRRSATTKLSYASDARVSPATHPICQILHVHSSRRVDSPIPEAPGNAPVGRKPPRSPPRDGSASPQAPALRARTSIFPLRRPSRLFSASLRAPRSAPKPD